MIRKFMILFLIIFLSCPLVGISTQAPALRKSKRSSISITFPFLVEDHRDIINEWLEADSDHESFMKSVNLEVREFTVGENTGYALKFCGIATTPSSTLKTSNATSDGKNNERCRCGQQLCKSALFGHEQWIIKTLHKDFRRNGEEVNKIFELLGWKCLTSVCFFCTDRALSSSSQFPIPKWNSNQEGYEFTELRSVFCWSTIYKTLIGLGSLAPIIWKRWLSTIIKKRKDIKLKKEFFKRNEGLLLQQQLASFDCGVDRWKTFSSEELNKATDYFNVNRILGQGGQGTVYRGILEDGRIVAIKRSQIVNQEKLGEFINEIVVLSQINHRNVVKLLGCCLETEVPILVYEFIPNGTLFQYLQDQNEEFPLTWDMRLRIAAEVAGALSYLHSAAPLPIFHRDIKSKNILLDNKCRAKVADFGASRSIAIDQTHLTTNVQGTIGYLDPEYHRSNQLTDKSDVFSFGVVLVELLTGREPIFSISSEENISLVTYFIHCIKENCFYDILDTQVLMQQGKKEEIMAFADLAKRCLNQNGKERPTMKEVAMELEAIRASKKKKLIFLGKLSKKWKS